MENGIFRLGELYCGPGGLAYGAINSSSEDGCYRVAHVWTNDCDADACETYRNNICPELPGSVYCEDVKNLHIESLDKIDAFAYGFPCNSFSKIGEHQGITNEKFGQLYWYGIEVLRKHQPQWFMAENVSGIKSTGSDDFQTIMEDMRESGYKLTINLYKSELYGIPQIRHRVIIVGIRDDIDVTFHVPDPAVYAGEDISARTALSGITSQMPNSEVKKLNDTVVRRLSYIMPGQNVWQAEDSGKLPEELCIKSNTKISQIYRKLDPEKPSYTIMAAGGGGTFGYHWTDRELSNRERARIQTFPDDYKFTGNYSSVRKQIGMAVPCKLSHIITTAVLNSFAGIPYDYVKANISEN